MSTLSVLLFKDTQISLPPLPFSISIRTYIIIVAVDDIDKIIPTYALLSFVNTIVDTPFG